MGSSPALLSPRESSVMQRSSIYPRSWAWVRWRALLLTHLAESHLSAVAHAHCCAMAQQRGLQRLRQLAALVHASRSLQSYRKKEATRRLRWYMRQPDNVHCRTGAVASSVARRKGFSIWLMKTTHQMLIARSTEQVARKRLASLLTTALRSFQGLQTCGTARRHHRRTSWLKGLRRWWSYTRDYALLAFAPRWYRQAAWQMAFHRWRVYYWRVARSTELAKLRRNGHLIQSWHWWVAESRRAISHLGATREVIRRATTRVLSACLQCFRLAAVRRLKMAWAASCRAVRVLARAALRWRIAAEVAEHRSAVAHRAPAHWVRTTCRSSCCVWRVNARARAGRVRIMALALAHALSQSLLALRRACQALLPSRRLKAVAQDVRSRGCARAVRAAWQLWHQHAWVGSALQHTAASQDRVALKRRFLVLWGRWLLGATANSTSRHQRCPGSSVSIMRTSSRLSATSASTMRPSTPPTTIVPPYLSDRLHERVAALWALRMHRRLDVWRLHCDAHRRGTERDAAAGGHWMRHQVACAWTKLLAEASAALNRRCLYARAEAQVTRRGSARSTCSRHCHAQTAWCRWRKFAERRLRFQVWRGLHCASQRGLSGRRLHLMR